MNQMNCNNCQAQNRATAKFCNRCSVSLTGNLWGDQLQTGQVMKNDYTIVRELGRGGMGAVYLAHQTMASVQRQVVVKEMLDYYDPGDPQASSRAQARFEAEAATLARLNVAHIPQIFDYFSERGRNYIVMQYIQGVNLEGCFTRSSASGQVIFGKPPSSKKIRQWGVQLCRVLESLAKQNIVHMDIKPANLVLDPSGQIWLVDFGTAKVQQYTHQVIQQTKMLGIQKSSIYGTVGYAPPEQYQGKVEPRSDVYALASTLYHLLTDDNPGHHPMDYPYLDRLPDGFAEPLRRALADDPRKRATATEFRELLESDEAIDNSHARVNNRKAKRSSNSLQAISQSVTVHPSVKSPAPVASAPSPQVTQKSKSSSQLQRSPVDFQRMRQEEEAKQKLKIVGAMIFLIVLLLNIGMMLSYFSSVSEEPVGYQPGRTKIEQDFSIDCLVEYNDTHRSPYDELCKEILEFESLLGISRN